MLYLYKKEFTVNFQRPCTKVQRSQFSDVKEYQMQLVLEIKIAREIRKLTGDQSGYTTRDLGLFDVVSAGCEQACFGSVWLVPSSKLLLVAFAGDGW